MEENYLDLCAELATRFEEDLKALMNKEVAEMEFLNQKDFKKCEDRADKFLKLATKRVSKILALGIAKHREDKHGEDTLEEQASLMAGLEPDDVEVGVMGWWSQ
jgi:hypothetical protein